jgi:diaminopimelate epimerase
LLEPSTVADVRMRIWNADGSEVEACGNASRCVARLLGGASQIETAGGMLDASDSDAGVSIDFPPPRFDWDTIPLAYPLDTAAIPAGWDELTGGFAVNVGNPHIVFFVDGPVADIDLARIGPIIEHDPMFPERVNVNIALVTGPLSLDLRVWERGVGLTRACGTGACATGVAAMATRRVAGPVTVTLPGGPLLIDWQQGGGIRMTGPATEVFRGTADWAQFG